MAVSTAQRTNLGSVGRWRVALALPVLAACSAAMAAAGHGRFGWLGLAPAEAGQTLQQAESSLGAPLRPLPSQTQGDDDCQPRATASQPGVVYTVDKGVVTRVETRDARYATVSGVRVGDDAAQVQRIYGKRLTVAPHAYFAQGRTLTVYSPDGKFALVMESNDAGRIITLRGGLVPAVQFLEGCSP